MLDFEDGVVCEVGEVVGAKSEVNEDLEPLEDAPEEEEALVEAVEEVVGTDITKFA